MKLERYVVAGMPSPVWVQNGDGSSLLTVAIKSPDGVFCAWFAQEARAREVVALLNSAEEN